MGVEGSEFRYDRIIKEIVARIDVDYTTARAALIDAIDAKTQNLPADPADQSAVEAAIAAAESAIRGGAVSLNDLAGAIATVAGYLDTEIAAIKAKTDALPTDPADQSAVEAAIATAEGNIRGGSETLETIMAAIAAADSFRVTQHDKLTGSAVAYEDATWVDALDSDVLAKDTEVTAVQIDNSGPLTGEIWRIVNGSGTKIFPEDTDVPVEDGDLKEIDYPVRVAAGGRFKVQVNCTAAAARTATVVARVVRHG